MSLAEGKRPQGTGGVISQSPKAGPCLPRLEWGERAVFAGEEPVGLGLVKSGGPVAGLSSCSELQSRFVALGAFRSIAKPEVSVSDWSSLGRLARAEASVMLHPHLL